MENENDTITRLKRELDLERRMETCWECHGTGYTPVGTAHQGTCLNCNGKGRAIPRHG